LSWYLQKAQRQEQALVPVRQEQGLGLALVANH
jgi:hypothetical protein